MYIKVIHLSKKKQHVSIIRPLYNILTPDDGTNRLSRKVGKTLPLILTFMGPCIANIFQYIFNKMQLYTVYYIWKLSCMFRVLLPPIIRRA